MCSSRKLCDKEDCQICFEKSFASHEKSKYWSDKNELTPRQVSKGSHKKAWFNCDKCGHTYMLNIYTIIESKINGCSFCGNQKLCDNDDCQTCFEKSFASHEGLNYWSDKNELKPRQVFKGAHAKYWFNCDCGHIFDSVLYSITYNNKWCPFCAHLKLCDNDDCQTCFEKSFASNNNSKYWSDKNELTPRQVFKRSANKYWFNCKCAHEFYSSLHDIIEGDNNGCGYCSNKKLCNNDDCQTCFKKSFASHERSNYWSDKNKINPRHIFKGTPKKYWFNCNICNHEFRSSLNHIIGNRWCPICVNKTEKKVYEQLLQIYPSLKTQFRTNWCRNPTTSRYLPFDFVIEEHKIIIELDGPQHFIQVRDWKSPEEHFKTDKYKEQCANENGYSVIRIVQCDVWNNAYDWLTELNEHISKIMNEDSVQNIYMGKNNEYNKFVM